MSARGLPSRDTSALVRRASTQTRNTADRAVTRAMQRAVTPAEVVHRVRAATVDMAGAGSTAATVQARKQRDASSAKSAAVLSALSRPTGSSLLDQYLAYREREDAAKAMQGAHDAAWAIEQRALRKAKKKICKQAEKGRTPQTAVSRGFLRYAQEGGRADYDRFTHKVVAP